MEKKKVSQDFLFNFIKDNGINVKTLAELVGLSNTMVNSCFRHNKDMNGVPRNFPEKSLPKLNAAIAELAIQLRQSLLEFGSDQAYTGNLGKIYDPACVKPINELHKYFKLTKFLDSTLGWSHSKKTSALHSNSSRGYGCISRDDVDRINARMLAVAGTLDSIEVVVPSDINKE